MACDERVRTGVCTAKQNRANCSSTRGLKNKSKNRAPDRSQPATVDLQYPLPLRAAAAAGLLPPQLKPQQPLLPIMQNTHSQHQHLCKSVQDETPGSFGSADVRASEAVCPSSSAASSCRSRLRVQRHLQPSSTSSSSSSTSSCCSTTALAAALFVSFSSKSRGNAVPTVHKCVRVA